MNILITGASGFVGKNVLLHKPAHWAVTAVYNKATDFTGFLTEHSISNVTAVQCDLADPAAVRACFAGKEFDACLYLAAHVDPNESLVDPFKDLQTNTVSLVNFLQSGVVIRRFVYFSSGSVYEGKTGAVNASTSIRPLLPYSIAKEMSERYIESFCTRGNPHEYVIVRFFGCYGPYEPERKIYRKVVRQFAIEKNPVLQIYGNGSNKIYAMYVDDAVQGIQHVIEGKAKNITVDFCGEEHYTIQELIERAAKVFDVHAQIQHTGAAAAEAHEFTVSNDAFFTHFHFRPHIPLDQALKRYAEHLHEEH